MVKIIGIMIKLRTNIRTENLYFVQEINEILIWAV